MRISGRIDMVLEEEDMLEFFVEFQTYFDMNDFIFVFEDKTKTGLPCKPHYHFIGTFTHKRDTVAKWLGTHGKGYFSTHEVKDEDENKKAELYILKQQDVIFHDLDENKLNILLSLSIEYNKNLSTLNGFRSHYLNKIMLEMKQEQLTKRHDILYHIIEYVKTWNVTNLDKPMFLPPSTQMLAYIQYYEQLHLTTPTQKLMDDYTFIYKEDWHEEIQFHDATKCIEDTNYINPLDIVHIPDFIDF